MLRDYMAGHVVSDLATLRENNFIDVIQQTSHKLMMKVFWRSELQDLQYKAMSACDLRGEKKTQGPPASVPIIKSGLELDGTS
jgi:hypothetical protein